MLKTLSDKATAVVAFFLLFEITVALGLAIGALVDYHFYASDSDTFAFEEAMRVKTDYEFENIENYYYLYLKNLDGNASEAEKARINDYSQRYIKDRCNILFIVAQDKNYAILCNFEDEVINSRSDTCYSKTKVFEFYDDSEQKISGTIKLYVRSNMSANDDYRMTARLINTAQIIKYPILVIFVIFIIASLVVMGMLMSSLSLKRDKNGNYNLRFIDRIPLDLLVLIMASVFAFIIGLIVLTAVADVREENLVLWNAIILLLAFIIALFILVLNMTVATRIKSGHVYKNTLLFKLATKIRKLLGKENDGYFKVPYIGKVVVTIGIVIIVDIVVLLYFVYRYLTTESGLVDDFPFMYFAVLHTIGIFSLVPLFIMMTINLNHLREGGQKLAEGDFDYTIDSHVMFGDFRLIGENLANIQNDMIKAVNEKNRSQEVRNELITNISHDLKTPLTSIVNYVNLLRRDTNTPAEDAEYMNILEKQSIKLKKLLEDLIEVSKLSTGDIAVNIDSINAGVFLEQTVCEFEPKFKAKQLETVILKPEEDVCIKADGDLLLRVFENLLNNICKYAKSDSRVYFEIVPSGDNVVVSFKNISKNPFRLTGDELVQRFKREDSARSSEGYGLGLSIAQSLTEIQNAHFEIHTDADLFKAILTFPVSECGTE